MSPISTGIRSAMAFLGRCLRKTWLFYYEGFKAMTVGKTLWIIILIKLIVLFGILRLFFFQPVLKGTDEQKANTVREKLLEKVNINK